MVMRAYALVRTRWRPFPPFLNTLDDWPGLRGLESDWKVSVLALPGLVVLL